MPDTGKKYPDDGIPFTRTARRTDQATRIPDGMSPVTGGRSSWAFWSTSLDSSDDAVVDVSQYVAPYARRGRRPSHEYLRVARPSLRSTPSPVARILPLPSTRALDQPIALRRSDAGSARLCRVNRSAELQSNALSPWMTRDAADVQFLHLGVDADRRLSRGRSVVDMARLLTCERCGQMDR
jgi:hypothetical protein